MCGTRHHDSRPLRRLAFGVALLAAGFAAVGHWPDCLPIVHRVLGKLRGFEYWSSTHASKPSELDRATATRDRLRCHLTGIQKEQREVAGQIRLLEAGLKLASVQGRTDAEETKGHARYEIQVRTQQLAAIDSQIKTTRRLLERMDALVLELQRDGTSERADRRVLLEAAELLWTYDPGRHGPNARIADWDWEAESNAGHR